MINSRRKCHENTLKKSPKFFGLRPKKIIQYSPLVSDLSKTRGEYWLRGGILVKIPTDSNPREKYRKSNNGIRTREHFWEIEKRNKNPRARKKEPFVY